MSLSNCYSPPRGDRRMRVLAGSLLRGAAPLLQNCFLLTIPPLRKPCGQPHLNPAYNYRSKAGENSPVDNQVSYAQHAPPCSHLLCAAQPQAYAFGKILVLMGFFGLSTDWRLPIYNIINYLFKYLLCLFCLTRTDFLPRLSCSKNVQPVLQFFCSAPIISPFSRRPAQPGQRGVWWIFRIVLT